jgi:transporter family protein
VVVVFTWLLAYLARQPTSFQALSKKTWIFLVLSGLGTGLSWLCYSHALQIGPASRVAPLDKLSVAIVIGTNASCPDATLSAVLSPTPAQKESSQ